MRCYMGVIKHYVANAIQTNPTRYGIDRGAVNIINDFFTLQGWPTLTDEQLNAIASLTRGRNYYLFDNEAYDHRTKKTAYEHIGQMTIFDLMDSDTAEQSKKLTRYFSADPDRIDQSNSRIKKSVRGVDDNHITAAKQFHPLLKSNPKLKQKRRQRKAPKQGASNNVFDGEVETNLNEVSE